MKIENFFSFETSIIKELIRPTYWIAIVAVLVGGLLEMMDHFIFGIIYIVLGMCLSRIVLETIQLIIEIHEKQHAAAVDDEED